MDNKDKEEKTDDLSLGIDDFLNPKESGPREGETKEASSEGEETPSPEKKASEEKPSPEKKETEANIKDEKKEGEKEEQPAVNWESDDNRYKKQYADTQTYANGEHMAKLDLEKQVRELKGQIDGTWEENKEPTAEEISIKAEYEGRVKASYHMAVKEHGEAWVEENIEAETSKFMKLRQMNPLIEARIRHSEMPYMEAVKILNEEQFAEKYGRDEAAIKENIKKEVETELRAVITKEFQEKLKAKEKLPADISEARGAPANGDDKKFKTTPLNEVFAF